ncbi:MAG: hypothetical protein H6560_07135 [Lewinellaceae bacterium]|nr:hypothetical protein [Lewinellaceae bacterium]
MLLNWIKNPDGTGDTDIELLKLDTAGQKLWSRTFGITSRNDAPHNVITTPGGYIIVSIRDNTNVAHQNIEAHNHIFKINEAGEVLWEYFSPSGELRGKEGRAIATSDGGLLVMTGQGIEVPAGTDSANYAGTTTPSSWTPAGRKNGAYWLEIPCRLFLLITNSPLV